MKLDNIILLDLDGVLITTPHWRVCDVLEDGYSKFNTICVTNLNRILKDTGYDIVLSSARRVDVRIDKMNEYFKVRGIKKPIIEYVPIYKNAKNRREEIELFIEEYKPKNYLVIDDDKSLSGADEEIKSNWIQTYMITGL